MATSFPKQYSHGMQLSPFPVVESDIPMIWCYKLRYIDDIHDCSPFPEVASDISVIYWYDMML